MTKNNENPFSVEKAEDSSGFLLWQVTTLWQRGIKKALDPHHLTHPQFVLLASIQWFTLQKQEITQILLANHTQIDPMTTSQVLRLLEKKEMIVRIVHPTDTRAKIVELTPLGKKTAKAAVLSIEKFDNLFFSSLEGKTKSLNKKLHTLLKGFSLDQV